MDLPGRTRVALPGATVGLCLLAGLIAAAAPIGAQELGDPAPWRYRYGESEIALELDRDRAIVLLETSARDDPLASLRRLADPRIFLPPDPEDLLEYPGLAELRFRPGLAPKERLAAIRGAGRAVGVELASARFAAGSAILVPRAELWVVLAPETAHETLAAIRREGDLTPIRSFPALEPTWLLSFAGSPLDAFDRARAVARLAGVRHCQPNFIRRIEEHGPPNDVIFPSQWGLENDGQYGGTPGSDIGAVEAWDIATGTADVTIAIVDEGVDVTHPELAANILPGHDSVTATPSPAGIPGNCAPGDAHGTACAGIAAAQGNNSQGIAGVCWSSRILPVRIGFGSFWTQDDWIVDGITWAADQGADVISCSWGGGPPSALEQAAVLYATTLGRGGLGAAVFASAGNGDSGSIAFPAAYPESIAVGASSPCDERKTANSCDGEWWWGSQWGPELDLVAPGPKVTTTDNAGAAGTTAGDFVEFSGTSSACPHVAGAAALLLSIEPQRTAMEIRQLLQLSARDLVGDPAEDVPGWDPYMGWGRLDLLELLIASGAGLAPPSSLACTPAGVSAELSWTNGAAYDSLIVSREGAVIATLPGTATSYIDPAPGIGLFRYGVRGVLAGSPSPQTSCSALVVGAATDLVWSPVQGAFDGGAAIAEGLLAAGRLPIIVDSLADAGALDLYDTVWVNLGIFPAKHVLTSGEGSALAAYLAGPGYPALYLEGGDTWFFDPPTAAHALFGIVPLSDGSSMGELTDISGAAGTTCDLSALAYDYVGENQWIDRIAPATGSEGVLSNVAPSFQVMVFRDAGPYCTTGASFEIAGLANGLDTREDLIAGILECWGVPFTVDPSPAPPTGILCTPFPGSIQLTWTLGDTYDEIRVRRNAVLLATLPGNATSFIDPAPTSGFNGYEVTGSSTGYDSGPAVCVLALAQPQNTLRVEDVSGAIGETVIIDVTADHALPLEGYVFAITYDPLALSVSSMTIAGTWFGTLGADFFAPAVDNGLGLATVSAMIDTIPPITEAVPPGNDHLILRLEGYVLPTSPFAGSTVIGLPESIGSPPLFSSFIENGGTAYPPTRVPGTLTILPDSSLRVRLPSVPAPAGGIVTHPVVVDTDRALLGYTFGIDFDAAALQVGPVGIFSTAAAGAEFFSVEVNSIEGWLTARAILDLAPPFTLWIDPGLAQPVLEIEWQVSAGVADGTQLDLLLVGGLGTPPVPLSLTDLAGMAFTPQVVDGAIHVGPFAGVQFRRGDANQDGALTLPDPITVLAMLFSGGAISCDDAADANDDGQLDLADAVYLLAYLFMGGNAPPAPFPGPGADPTADPLGC